jgi:hypothetical protein
MKHALAPWKVIVHDYDEDGNYTPKEVPYGYRSGDFGGNPYIVDANGETVAGNDEYYAFSTPENVRLMVHAPELLEALKTLVLAVNNESSVSMYEAYDTACVAIAKAEGA